MSHKVLSSYPLLKSPVSFFNSWWILMLSIVISALPMASRWGWPAATPSRASRASRGGSDLYLHHVSYPLAPIDDARVKLELEGDQRWERETSNQATILHKNAQLSMRLMGFFKHAYYKRILGISYTPSEFNVMRPPPLSANSCLTAGSS